MKPQKQKETATYVAVSFLEPPAGIEPATY